MIRTPMKTKILVIPVNLGFTIDDIINTDLTELTQESQVQLNKAINIAKAIQAAKDEKEKTQLEKTNRTQRVTEEIFNKIIESGKIGMPLSDIKTLLEPVNLSLSALTTKLKQAIQSQNPNSDLEKSKRGGLTYYKFITLD
jgi:CHAT domain-containing protein